MRCRQAAEKLRPFFLNTMIESEEKDGQDVLHYDPALDGKSNSTVEDVMQVYRTQRFFPLLECLPANLTSMRNGLCDNSTNVLMHISVNVLLTVMN